MVLERFPIRVEESSAELSDDATRRCAAGNAGEVVVLIERQMIGVIRPLGASWREHERLGIHVVREDAAGGNQQAFQKTTAVEADVER